MGSRSPALTTSPAAAALALASLAGCDAARVPAHLQIAGADPGRGARAIAAYGCGSCHRIPGIRGAQGLVGPPLDAYAHRALLAGQLPNTPANLVAWLVDPPRLVPATGMPNVGVSVAEARDIAAYLYTLDAGRPVDWPPPVPPDRPGYDDPDRAD